MKIDETRRNYKFSWELLGNLSMGRPNLGDNTRVEIYRLMQFTLRDVIEKNYGSEMTDKIFYDAGKMAGLEFYKNYLNHVNELNEFIRELKILLRDFGIGILRIEEMDLEKGQVILTVAEDLNCSGLPDNGIEICIYDEGFICALLESFFGVKFEVREIDCWCTGDRTCRFEANII